MTRPLNILIVNSGRKWIGEVAHCVALQRELGRRGHRVWIGCRAGHELHDYVARAELDHIAFEFTGGFSPMADTRDAHRMARFVREIGIDLVHAHRGKDHWMAVAAARMTHFPIVRTRHVVTPVKGHWANLWLYSRATAAVISVSRAVEAGFGRLAKRIPNRCVILSPVDHEKFNPARRSEEWRREAAEGLAGGGAKGDRSGAANGDSRLKWVGLIGRFQTVKGQRVFLRAAGRVAAEVPEARFLLAGRGEAVRIRKYGELATELGYGDRLKIMGVLEDLPTALASLDVSVIPSLGSEGSSRVGMESMASGAPIVASWVGGIPEILAPEGFEMDRAVGVSGPGPHWVSNGALVAPGDPDALAEGILQALRRPDLTGPRVQSALASARERHDPALWAERVEQVYLKALERPS